MSINPYESPKETEVRGLSVEPIPELTDGLATHYQIAGTLTLVMGIGLGTTVAMLIAVVWNRIGFEPLSPAFAIVICVIVGGLVAVCSHLLLLWIVCKVFGITQRDSLPIKEAEHDS